MSCGGEIQNCFKQLLGTQNARENARNSVYLLSVYVFSASPILAGQLPRVVPLLEVNMFEREDAAGESGAKILTDNSKRDNKCPYPYNADGQRECKPTTYWLVGPKKNLNRIVKITDLYRSNIPFHLNRCPSAKVKQCVLLETGRPYLIDPMILMTANSDTKRKYLIPDYQKLKNNNDRQKVWEMYPHILIEKTPKRIEYNCYIPRIKNYVPSKRDSEKSTPEYVYFKELCNSLRRYSVETVN
jgi:hypothetical protein